MSAKKSEAVMNRSHLAKASNARFITVRLLCAG